jgi:hypothetical protein
MKDWVNNLAPDSVHREVYDTATLVAMDYANVPPYLDETHQWNVGGRDVTPVVNMLRRGLMPYGKFPYNLARQGKRWTIDALRDVLPGNVQVGGFDVTRGAKTDWAQKRSALAALTMMTGRLPPRSQGDGGRRRPGAATGTQLDDLGKKLDGAYNTAGRMNVTRTPLGRSLTAMLDCLRHARPGGAGEMAAHSRAAVCLERGRAGFGDALDARRAGAGSAGQHSRGLSAIW